MPEAVVLHSLRRNWAHVEPLSRGSHLADLGLIEPDKFQLMCRQMRHGYISRRTGFGVPWGALTFERWLSLGGLDRIDVLRRDYRARVQSLLAVPEVDQRPATSH